VSRKLLLVEDDVGIRQAIRRYFAKRGFEVLEADGCAAAEEQIRAGAPDVAVVDYYLPDGDGLRLLRACKTSDNPLPVVILTGHGSIDVAVRAMKEGAEQFFTKPVELPTLLVVVERLIESHRAQQLRLAGKTRQARQVADPFLGESAAIRGLADRARRVLATASPILIQGETGSGKGLLASWLHQHGPRAEEPFVDLNCAGLSRELLESELFGHEKGAFTGAVAAKSGLLEVAHKGTLFLDEIGDIDPLVAPKLLTVLEEHRFRRLGEVRDRHVDVRLLAATHHDLARRAEEGAFRSDLYYRISTIVLQVPPLRERGRDVALIARALLSGIAADLGRPGVGLSPSAETLLLEHAWPGNVRELRNVLERAVLLGDSDELSDDDLRAAGACRSRSSDVARVSLQEAERRHIASVLAGEDGNVVRAAEVLGLSRSALYQKLRKHGLQPSGS
jgi:DNA-binding NtrC family response regulator